MLDRFVFGGASFSGLGSGYGLGELVDCNSQELFDYVYEHGIRIYDFAPIYGFNQAEIEMGKLIKNKRDEIKLVSKAGITWHENKRVDMNNDPKIIKKMFDQSLKNFNTDYIDIYMIHWPSKNIDIRYSVEVLENLRAKGKIKDIGLSNSNEEDFKKAKEVAQISFLQGEVNLFNQNSFKVDDIQKMGWGTLDKGILAGTVTLDRNFTKEDARSHAFWWKKSNWKEKVKFVESIKDKFKINNDELLSLSIKFALNNCQLPILGFKSISQVNKVLSIRFDNDDLLREVSNEFALF